MTAATLVQVGQRVSVPHNGGHIVGRVAITDDRWAWLRIESAKGVYWPPACIPDIDDLYPVARALCTRTEGS